MSNNIIVLYSWNHRPDECATSIGPLRESPCPNLTKELNSYAQAGFELKSVNKYEEYTHYILQRIIKNSEDLNISHMKNELRRVTAENISLKERLRIGYKELKMNVTRERIRRFKIDNPNATIREIQKACHLSSTRSVTYHLEKIKLEEFGQISQPALREAQQINNQK